MKQGTVAPLVAALFCVAGLQGCDTIYGIDSRKVVETDPSYQCVIDALKRTPGVTEVQARTAAFEGWLIAGAGPRHGTPIKYFSYSYGSNWRPMLMIDDRGPGRYMVSDTMLSMNQRIPEAEMQKALPIMLAAEAQISRDCGVAIDSGMNHRCDDSDCEPPA